MDGGVGLTAIGADLQGLIRQLFCPIGVPGDGGASGVPSVSSPTEGGLVELLGHRGHDLEAAVHLFDVPGAAVQVERPAAAKKNSSGSPTRSARASASAVQASARSSEGRHLEGM